jgi:hypothetical protein
MDLQTRPQPRALVVAICLGVLLGHQHHAYCRLRGLRCHWLRVSHLSDFYLNLQLRHTCVQHQLRGLNYSWPQGEGGTAETAEKGLSAVSKIRSTFGRSRVESRNLHRIVRKAEEKIQLLIGTQVYSQSASLSQGRFSEIIQQTSFQCPSIFSLRYGKDSFKSCVINSHAYGTSLVSAETSSWRF